MIPGVSCVCHYAAYLHPRDIFYILLTSVEVPCILGCIFDFSTVYQFIVHSTGLNWRFLMIVGWFLNNIGITGKTETLHLGGQVLSIRLGICAM